MRCSRRSDPSQIVPCLTSKTLFCYDHSYATVPNAQTFSITKTLVRLFHLSPFPSTHKDNHTDLLAGERRCWGCFDNANRRPT